MKGQCSGTVRPRVRRVRPPRLDHGRTGGAGIPLPVRRQERYAPSLGRTAVGRRRSGGAVSFFYRAPLDVSIGFEVKVDSATADHLQVSTADRTTLGMLPPRKP